MTAPDLSATYGDRHADWLAALVEACAATSQAAVARRLDYSSTLINLLLNGKYEKDLTEVERRVRRVLMGPLDCPVMGPISDADCRENQALPYSPANHQRVTLFRACRRHCRHSSIKRPQPGGAK